MLKIWEDEREIVSTNMRKHSSTNLLEFRKLSKNLGGREPKFLS